LKLNLRTHFDSAHRLTDYNGPCARLHGHRWDILCSFEYDHSKLAACGLACDFKELKAIVNKVLPDHELLNDIVTFNPTAENLAPWLADRIVEAVAEVRRYFPHLIPTAIDLVRLELWESPDCSVVWE
jgi:6-pyruvoyltetrahydropterin/6-carboxytetrahydropterin synthase